MNDNTNQIYLRDNLKEMVAFLNKWGDFSINDNIFFSKYCLKDLKPHFNFKFTQVDDNIFFRLDTKDFKIFKTKQDVINSFEKTDKVAMVIEDELIYIEEFETPNLFENVIFSKEILTLFRTQKNIDVYDDKTNKKLVLCLKNGGITEMGYGDKPLDFFNRQGLFDVYDDKTNKKLVLCPKNKGMVEIDYGDKPLDFFNRESWFGSRFDDLCFCDDDEKMVEFFDEFIEVSKEVGGNLFQTLIKMSENDKMKKIKEYEDCIVDALNYSFIYGEKKLQKKFQVKLGDETFEVNMFDYLKQMKLRIKWDKFLSQKQKEFLFWLLENPTYVR